MANLLPIAAAVTTCLGVVFIVVSLSTNYWRSSNVVHEGLFERCNTNKGSTYCWQIYKKISNVPANLHGVRALMILGVMIQGLVIIAGAVSIFMKKNWNAILAGAQSVALIFSVAGLCIYASKFDDEWYSLKWSYALAWIGTISHAASIVFLVLIMLR